MTDARIILWGRQIAAVSWLPERGYAVFQYAPEFIGSGIEISPLMMPLREGTYEFPNLARETFKGLPGLLADSLPDKFGNALIDTWLARQGRATSSFDPVERLCYTGQRGMGALEFEPTILERSEVREQIQVDALVRLANDVMQERTSLRGQLVGQDDTDALKDILRVGTSAGGARAKAVLMWNEQTGEFRSGQLPAENGFTSWLIKFDGVTGNGDKEIADPQGYGRIEYAYSQMAKEAGIEMTRCRLHHEGGRAHFMTKRFDRTAEGKKLHLQSLGGMMHFDFNLPGAYSYEQAIQVAWALDLPMSDRQQQVRRAIFNVVARNQDDHVKNIAYLMNREGRWRLSPAYDVVYAYNPDGAWTGQHQMSIQGQRDQFDQDDFIALGQAAGIKKPGVLSMIDQVRSAVEHWPKYASDAGVEEQRAMAIKKSFRSL